MPILIKGVRLSSLGMTKEEKTGQFKVHGEYELLSQNDIVVAKDSFNSTYGGGIKVEGVEITKALNELITSVKNTLEATLGFTKGGE